MEKRTDTFTFSYFLDRFPKAEAFKIVVNATDPYFDVPYAKNEIERLKGEYRESLMFYVKAEDKPHFEDIAASMVYYAKKGFEERKQLKKETEGLSAIEAFHYRKDYPLVNYAAKCPYPEAYEETIKYLDAIDYIKTHMRDVNFDPIAVLPLKMMPLFPALISVKFRGVRYLAGKQTAELEITFELNEQTKRFLQSQGSIFDIEEYFDFGLYENNDLVMDSDTDQTLYFINGEMFEGGDW